MAGFTEHIKLVIDVVTGNSKTQLGQIKTQMDTASTGLGKLKAAAAGAFTALAASPTALLTAGAAIGSFAVKGVADFQKVALQAGKFADATGLTVQEASKWLEVADHIGVSNQAVESAFRRMDVAIGNNSAGWRDLGVEVKKNADGTTNLSETFLRAVTALQKIEDPAKRAAAAQKLFGKGYAEVAELIGRSAPELSRMLSEVGEAKVIDERELEKAREFRSAMDDLSDSVQEAGMTFGEMLIPALTSGAKFLTVFSQGLQIIVQGEQDVTAATKESMSAFGENENQKEYERLHAQLAATMEAGRTEAHMYIGSADALSARFGETGDAVDSATAAFDRHAASLQGVIDAQLAALDSTLGVAAADRAVVSAVEEANTAVNDSKTAVDEQAAAYDNATDTILRAATAHADLAVQTSGLTDKTEIANLRQQTLIDTLSVMGAQASGKTKADIDSLIASLKAAGEQKPKPTLDANPEPAKRKAQDVQRDMDALDKRRPNPILNADHRPARLSVAAAFELLRNFAAQRPTSTINVRQMGADAAERIINNAARNRTSTISVNFNSAAFHVPYLHADGRFYASGGLVPGAPNAAVPAVLHGGEYVLSADVVDRIRKGMQSYGAGLRGGGGGTAGNTYHVNVNTGVGDPVAIGRAVKEAIAAAERVGVR